MTFDPTSAVPEAEFDPTSAAPDSGPGINPVVRGVIGIKPDDYAEAEKLAKRYLLPAPTAYRKLPELRQQAQSDDVQEKLRTTKALQAYLAANPGVAAQAHDDVGVLADLENFARDLGGAVKAGVYRSSKGAAGTFRAGLELVAPVLDVTEPTDPDLTRNPLLPYIPLPGGNPLRRLAEGFAMQAAGADSIADTARPKKDGALVGGFFSGIESLTQNLLSLPMAFAPGGQGAALAAMTAQTGGDAYQDAREKGLGIGQALPFAASQAAIEYATEKLPLGALLKDVKAGAGFLLTAGKQIALEVPGEQIATVLQDLNEWAVLNPDKPFTSYLEERPSAAAQTLVATVVGAGGNVAVAKGIEAVIERATRDGVNMQRAGVMQQAMEQALKGAEASALRERNPEAFRALMQSMSEDGSVYVDAEVLAQLPTDVLQQMGGVAAELELALPINAPVAVKLADVLTFAPGTPAAEVFMQNVRSAPDAPTALEAEQAGAKAQEFLQSEAERVITEAQDQEAVRASSEAVRTTILSELNATGRYRPAVSEAMSQWAGAFYTTMASRLGMTPEQMFQKYRLKVLGEASGAGQAAMEQGRSRFRLNDLPRDMREELFNEHAMNLNPDATERGFYAKSVPTGVLSLEGVQVDNIPDDQLGRYANAAELPPIVIADGRLIDGQHRIAAARKQGITQLRYIDVTGLIDTEAGGFISELPAGAALNQSANDPSILSQQTTSTPRGTFTPSTLELVLNPNANLSTWFHETGHFFLEVMSDLASQPDAPPQIAEDMGKILEWFGIKGDENVGGPNAGGELAQAAAQGYEGSDAGEAAEWLAAVAKGLDMSPEARMARAEAMGFDTSKKLYHSTLADTKEFAPFGAFMGFTGTSGISVTDSPEMASRYLDRYAEFGWVDGKPNQAFNKNVIPVFIKPGNVLERNEPFPMPPGMRLGAPLPAGYVPAHKKMGYDTLVRDDAISRKGPVKHSDAKNAIRGKEYVLTDPSQARSIFAAFDPDNAASGNLLAQDGNLPTDGSQAVRRTPLETWRAMTLDQQRPYHERWAESIEQYVMDGKAPSVELAPLMRRFAAWLKSVYGSIKAFLASRGVVAQVPGALGQSAKPRKITNLKGEKVDAPRVFYRGESPGAARVRVGNAGWDSALYAADSERAASLYGSTITRIVAKPTARIVYEGTAEFKNMMVGYKMPERRGGLVEWGAEAQRRAKAEGYAAVWFKQQADIGTVILDRSQFEIGGDLLNTDGGILSQDPNAQPGANIQLNDDIRRVMDRMLATDEQIAQANEVAGLMPDEAADGEAIDRLRKRSMADLKWTVRTRDAKIKEIQKQAAAVRKATEAEVRAEVEQMPEVRAKAALDELRKAKNLNDLTSATVADSFGYESVDAMLKAIDAFGKKKDVIDGLTERRMLEEHGDLINEDAITQAANEAVHNAARARSLATELKTQAEMLGAREDTGEVNAKGRKITASVIAKAAEQFAARVVGRTPLRDLKNRAWQHTAAERRAGKRWQEATSAGKTEEAVKAKQDQVLNHAAARAALDAQAEAKRIVTFFRDRVAKGNDEKVVEKGRDPDIVNAARAVLAAYGVRTPATKGAQDYLDALKTNDPETYAVVAPMVAEATKNAQPIEALTYDELVGLHEQIEAMWHLAKRSRQMEVDGNLLDIQDAADELHARMVDIGIPDRIPGEGRAVTKAEQRGTFLKQGMAFVRRVEQWAEGMDGKYGGPFLRLVFQPVKDAADRYRADRIKYRKKLQALVDTLAPVIGDATIDAPELGYTFGTPGSTAGTAMNEVLHAILHTGNESNKRKLLLGRQWATENADGTLDTARWDAFLRRLANEGKLQPAHMDFVQGVWDLLEETKPLAQRTHRDVFGRYFAEVTADAFIDPFGVQRKGGYVPAQVDTRLVKDNELRKLAESENESMAFAFPQPNRGFTKSRTEYNRPLMLDLRTLGQHLDKVLLFSHMTPASTGARRLLMNKGVSQALGRIQPEAMAGMLQPWLQRSAQQIVETPVVGAGKWARIPGVIRSRAGMALMFANVSNTIQQITGLSTAAVKVKPSHMLRAAAQFVAHPTKFASEVWALSPYMDDRAKNEVAMMNEQMQDILLRPGVYQRAQSWSMRHAYFLQTAFDNVLSPIIWTGAYNQALTEGMSDKDAIRFADGTVRQTQGSTLPEDVSRIESGDARVRAFTQFVSYFNMMANTNATALKQIAGEIGLKKGAGKALYVVAMGLMVPLWVAEAIAVAFRGGPEDEDDDGYLDDWLAAVFGFGTIKGLLAQVPIIGQFGVAAFNRFNDNPLDDRISLSPAVSLIESSLSAPFSVYAAAMDEGSQQKAIRDVATLVSVFTGIPVYAAARPLGYAAGVADDRIEPTSGADAVRGLVTGAASAESKQ